MILPGLCGDCTRARVVRARRGSRFYLCSRSATDPRYPRYPRLPVLSCPGHEAVVPDPRTIHEEDS
jgi:hypothetical protein